jgi:two-component system, response regulator PdtaR
VPVSAESRPIILVVEDDTLIRLNAADMVRDLGFEVIEAVDSDHAVSILESTDGISVVFTDVQMPGSMDGLRLVALVRDRWPPIALLVTSGRVQPPVEDLPLGARFLTKPYFQDQLKTHLQALTGAGCG